VASFSNIAGTSDHLNTSNVGVALRCG